MDHSEPDQNYKHSYSQQPRSRVGRGLPSTDNFLRNITLIDSPGCAHLNSRRPVSTQGLHSPSLISRTIPSPAAFTSATSTQSYSSLPIPQQGHQNLEWSDRDQARDTPLVRVDRAQDNSPPHSQPTSTPPSTANMSAVAVQFDSRFEMGAPRSSYTWPTLENGTDLLGHDLGSIGHGSDASLTPPSSSRSITASPPRGTLTPEQRELKRQRDQARRDSKTSVRARRALSSSYNSRSPPASMSEFSTSSALPIYSTSPSQISLLAEPVTTMSGSNYLPPYSTSPLPEQGNAMFSPFPSLSSNDYIGLGYSPGYPPQTSGHNLSSHYSGRPTSLHDQGMLYPVAPVLPSGGSGSAQDPSHVRVVQSRPKPQCWEHGCNGRQFSTFSNLLRHQREKSGQAAKASCPNCGAEFTRTTARNGHMQHDKCKQRRNS